MKKQLFLATAVFFLIGNGNVKAFSFPEFNKEFQLLPPFGAAFPPAGVIDTYNFEGIVALSNCSGSLIRFENSLNTDKALVLTNGHCVGMLDPGVVYVNQASSRTFQVLNKSAGKIGTVNAQTLLFATMTRTDVALYRLAETYQDIQTKYRIPAFTLASTTPQVNTDIQVISGYWKRGYSCKIEAEVFKLREGDWTFENSLRYSRPGCEVIGGTSGSPVIQAGTKRVIAINNTINESGERCEVNNPCEVDTSGNVFYEQGIGYAQQTYWIYSCLDEYKNLNLNLPGCQLPKPQN